jgi:hypothetical protein
MIDRIARNRLAQLIRRYLNDQITAFELDESLDACHDSKDDAVRFVADALWYYYDDYDDHLVVMSKPQWNYIQRLSLLLESDSKVTFTKSWRWTHSQILAAVLFLLSMGVVAKSGFGLHLLIFFIPYGIGSIAISHFRRPVKPTGPYDAIVTPFESIGDLRVALNAASYRKERYRAHLATRRIRSRSMDWFWLAYSYICWSMFAPIPLLFQCFPYSVARIKTSPA